MPAMTSRLWELTCVGSGERGLTWEFFESICGSVAMKLEELAGPEKQAIVLQPRTRLGGMALLGGALSAGLTPILDEKRHLHPTDHFGICVDEQAMATLDFGASEIKGRRPLSGVLTAENWEVVFCTSGTTGQPVLVKKHGRGLLAEAQELRLLFRLAPKMRVLTLVTPMHIYGFLHSFLLPWCCECSVHMVDLSHGVGQPDIQDGSYIDLLVMVPATFSYAQRLSEKMIFGAMVTSGAPFGVDRTARLRSWVRRPAVIYEILGSTETGGVGYRRLDLGEEAFTCFPGVHLCSVGEPGTRVESPYLWPGSSCVLPDFVQIIARTDGERFVHMGRSDRVFKYGGRRHSLEEIERNMQQLLKGGAVVCEFVVDDKVPHGGHLVAWVEGAPPVSTSALRHSYLEMFSGPVPQRIEVIDRLPRDSNGKIQSNLLRSIPRQT
jgi:acyl-coenzyme A synthetase/AMP-(fatty) acid ligase